MRRAIYGRVTRLERAMPASADEVDPGVAAFMVGMSRQERQALLARVRGHELSDEQATALAVAEARWQQTRRTP